MPSLKAFSGTWGRRAHSRNKVIFIRGVGHRKDANRMDVVAMIGKVVLASRNHIAVHPVIGWWRTRKREKRYERSVRYSLIVSIFTPSTDVDVYTPVAIETGIGVPVEIVV
jgi:hypothetical protein